MPLIGNAPVMRNKLVFPPAGRWDPATHLRLTQEHRVTSWTGVPTQFWRMLQHPDFESADLASVRTVGSGGSTFAPELFRLFAEKMPWVSITNGYGMTETTGMGTWLGGERGRRHVGSVGAEIPGSRVEIRGADDAPVPDGAVGEICMHGAGVFLGYWDDPDATAGVLDSDRWYRSGDYGRSDGDVLTLESRMRDLIIRGGENIYPIEIENRLVEHPAIAEACVIGVDHQVLGQEVKAFVVPAAGATIDPADVRAWAAATLAAFKVPAVVEVRDSLPYNAVGKVLKHLLEDDEHEPHRVSVPLERINGSRGRSR